MKMAQQNASDNGTLWARITVVIVIILMAALYFGGFFARP
jgi:hypothetical protein